MGRLYPRGLIVHQQRFRHSDSNVDISNLVHKMRFWNNPHQVKLKVEKLESQIINKKLGVSKQTGLNRIAKVGYGHLRCLVEHLADPAVYRWFYIPVYYMMVVNIC